MSKFFWGYISCTCIHSLMQDSLGKDRYIQSVLDHWVDPIYTVPIAAGILIIAVLNAMKK